MGGRTESMGDHAKVWTDNYYDDDSDDDKDTHNRRCVETYPELLFENMHNCHLMVIRTNTILWRRGPNRKINGGSHDCDC